MTRFFVVPFIIAFFPLATNGETLERCNSSDTFYVESTATEKKHPLCSQDGRILPFFEEQVLPKVYKEMKLDPLDFRVQIQVKDFPKHLRKYGAYYDPNVAPQAILINAEAHPNDLRQLAIDLLHELGHLFFYHSYPKKKFSKTSWELREGMSLLWEYVVFEHLDPQRLDLAIKALNENTLWDLSEKNEKTYGRLSLIYYGIYVWMKVGGDDLFTLIYEQNLKNVDEILASIEMTREELVEHLR